MGMDASLRALLTRLTPKGWALRHYSKVLPYRLRADYGHQGPYTPAQIDGTLRRYRVGNKRYAPYAIAMFTDGKALPATWNGSPLQAIRGEISAYWFDGAAFDYRDVMSYCSHYGGDSGQCDANGHTGGEHSDGGGHH
jgi:hypothetical protein